MKSFCLVVEFQFIESQPVSDFRDAGIDGLGGNRFCRSNKGQVDLSDVCIHMKAKIMGNFTKRECVNSESEGA